MVPQPGSKHRKWAGVLTAVLVYGGEALSQRELRGRTAAVLGMTGVPEATFRNWFADLQNKNLAKVDGASGCCRLGSACGYVVGVALGSETIRAGLFDANGLRLKSAEADPVSGQLKQPATEVLERVPPLVRELTDWLPARDTARMVGVSLALPAPLNRRGYVSGVCHGSWRDQPFEELLRQVLAPGTRTKVVNDANADAVNLAFDVARLQYADPDKFADSTMLMTIRLSGGVGAGLIELGAFDPRQGFAFSRSHLIEGSTGYAGEIGHMEVAVKVQDDRYHPCSCGLPAKHLEGFVSARALLQRVGAGPVDATQSLRAQLDALPFNDEEVRVELREIGKILGRSVAGAIRLVDPSVVQLTGVLARDDVQKGFTRHADQWDIVIPNQVRVEVSTDLYSAARGAALLLFRDHVYRRLPEVAADAD